MKSIIFFIIVIGLFTSCNPTFECEDQILLSLRSPDGKYIACLYERDCGATTDTSTTINIREEGVKFDGGEGRVFVIKGKAEVELIWKEPQLLIVTSNATENIFTQEKRWKELAIQYSAKP